ncbi:DUF6892 domain-containing protein [Curtobacterium sp. AB7]|uniref:DUF6892 domain-containing protein n=1 Tax=Curtobacterium sp. AB7 TaxID=3349327 RepID=UPI003836075A
MDHESNTTEEPVEFADFNAKLLVLDVLCYDLDVLDPYDPETADETEEDLDVDGQDDRAREYYDDLELLPSHLSLVTELSVDTELEVLQDVHPGWEGSDDRFDPQNWDDVLDLPALRTVYAAAPLPAHVAEALGAKGVEFRSA